MTTSDHKKLHDRTVKAEIAYISGRVRKLAQKLTDASVSDDVGADILERNIDHMGRSVGRRAQGAHMPTQGFVCVDGDYRLRVAHNPTCRIKDHKAHRALRVEACTRAFASGVDRLRTWSHMTAPYRPGGYRWAKMGRVGKREYRALLHTCDHMVANGEVTAATELFRGI